MTRRAEVLEELRELVGLILARKRSPIPASRIDEGASLLRDLGIDSLDVLQLAAAVERRYGIRLPDPERSRLDNLAALAAAVLRRLEDV
jgi:acyl carrier protein